MCSSVVDQGDGGDAIQRTSGRTKRKRFKKKKIGVQHVECNGISGVDFGSVFTFSTATESHRTRTFWSTGNYPKTNRQIMILNPSKMSRLLELTLELDRWSMDDSVAKGFFQHQTRLRPRNWSRFSQINREMITPFPHPTATATKQSFSAPNRFHSPNEHRITRNDRNQVFRWKIRRFLVTFVSNEPVEMDTRDNKRQQRQKKTQRCYYD